MSALKELQSCCSKSQVQWAYGNFREVGRVCYLFSLGSLCLEIPYSPLKKMSQLAKYGQVHTAAKHKTKQYNPVAHYGLALGSPSPGSVVYDP